MELLEPYSWNTDYIWLSLDVSFLYTSIPHTFGPAALRHFLFQDQYMNDRQAAFILDSTKFCLEHNYFAFDDQFYVQVQGTAMGANFAPPYANLAMGLWEHEYVWNNNPYSRHLVYYGRYIDDIIINWSGSPQNIPDFVNHCNHNPHGLGFTYISDADKLAFLDLELYHVGDTIHVRNYSKPTAGISLLHYKSCHHHKWKNNIPRGKFCRLKRNCTNHLDFIKESSVLGAKLRDKGYPESLIQDAYMHYLSDTPLRSKEEVTDQPVRFTTRFHHDHKKMEGILKKHWPILLEDPHLKTLLPKFPIVTYRRASNVKNKIAPSKLKPLSIQSSPRLCLLPLYGMFQCRKAL